MSGAACCKARLRCSAHTSEPSTSQHAAGHGPGSIFVSIQGADVGGVSVGECGRMCVDVGGVCGWMWVDVILSLFLAFFLSLPLLFDTRRFLFKTLSSIMGPCAEILYVRW